MLLLMANPMALRLASAVRQGGSHAAVAWSCRVALGVTAEILVLEPRSKHTELFVGGCWCFVIMVKVLSHFGHT